MEEDEKNDSHLESLLTEISN